MTNTMQVDVVSIEESIFSGLAEFIVLPGEAGELGIYPRHTPLITRIKPGAVRIVVPGQTEELFVFVAGGVIEVQPTHVIVLAEVGIRGKDLDQAKATVKQKPPKPRNGQKRCWPIVARILTTQRRKQNWPRLSDSWRR
jgi:F-type H+-transporting ATPase subunit epsilon